MSIYLAAVTGICLGTINVVSNAGFVADHDFPSLLEGNVKIQKYFYPESNQVWHSRTKQAQPNNDDRIISNNAGYHNERGYRLLRQQGGEQQALQAFDEAIELDRDFAWAHYGRGLVLAKLSEYLIEAGSLEDAAGSLEKAAGSLDQAIKLFSERPGSVDQSALVEAYFQLGETYFQLGLIGQELGLLDQEWYANARDAFQQSIKIQEIIQAQQVVQNREPSQPQEEVPSQALFAEPELFQNPEPSQPQEGVLPDEFRSLDRSHYRLGRVFTELRNYSEAQYYFLRSIGLYNDSFLRADAYQALGDIAQVHEKNYTLAVTYYTLAITINPELATAHHKLGVSLTESGIEEFDEGIQGYFFDEAERAFNKAIELYKKKNIGDDNKNFEKTYTALGNLYFSRGLYGESIEQYKLALVLDDNFIPALEGLEKATKAHVIKDAEWYKEDVDRYVDTLEIDELEKLKLFRSVLRIISYPPTGREEGTGFVIKAEGSRLWVLTNRHVIAGKDFRGIPIEHINVEVEFYTDLSVSPEERSRRLRLPATKVMPLPEDSNDLDIAVVIVDSAPIGINPLQLATDTSASPPRNITVIGHPSSSPDGNWSSESGEISNHSEQFLQLSDSNTASGSSGGPVIYENDDQSQVVGMLTSIRVESDYLPGTETVTSTPNYETQRITGRFASAYRVNYFMDALIRMGVLD